MDSMDTGLRKRGSWPKEDDMTQAEEVCHTFQVRCRQPRYNLLFPPPHQVANYPSLPALPTGRRGGAQSGLCPPGGGCGGFQDDVDDASRYVGRVVLLLQRY